MGISKEYLATTLTPSLPTRGQAHRPLRAAMIAKLFPELHRAAMARSSERGFNGWYTYGFWYAAWTATVTITGLVVVKVWGPKLGQIDPPIKKGHKDLRTGEVHVFQPRARPLPADQQPNEEGR